MVSSSVLPYAVSSSISVYKDDGNWDDYSAWFMRSDQDLNNLFVCNYQLPTDEDGDVDYSRFSWEKFSQKLVEDHPDCLFIYT